MSYYVTRKGTGMSLIERHVLSTLAVMVGVAVLLGALTAAPVFGAEVCPNEQLRIENRSTGLPECRAYEQVTPIEKHGAVFNLEQMGPGASGFPDLITNSLAAIDGAQNFEAYGVQYSIVRAASGWGMTPLAPPASEYLEAFTAEYENPQAVSLDVRSGVWLESLRSEPENRVDLFITHPGTPIEEIGPVTQPGSPLFHKSGYELTEQLGYFPRAWSDDLSRFIYSQTSHHWPFDKTKDGDESIYEYIGTGNTEPLLIGVDDGSELISDCGTSLGGIRVGNNALTRSATHNAVSADGDTVFFTADECGSSPAAYELFARIDNGQPDAHTVAISEPSAEDCASCDTSGPEDGNFEGASVDGTKVFFVTEQPLLGGDRTKNIYEYDFSAPAGERVIRVSGGDSTVSDPTAEVQGVVATSEDGSHVYFVAHGVLTRTPDSRGQVAQAGADNLYVFERDAQYPAGRTAFIAELSQGDEPMWQAQEGADVTPDGRFLVFTSADDLTPDDTSTVAQVFEYDAQTGSLVRVSVGQDGYNDNGNTDVAPASIAIPSGRYYGSQSPVAADGTVFFESTDGLTPQALNHQVIGKHYEGPDADPEEKFSLVYGNNIYEYREGSVYLISDGRDVWLNGKGEADVKLLGTDESGEDVLFTTVDQFVPQDTDTDIDIYDARVDGGVPAPLVSQECSGDGCQGPLSAAPTLLSPGSEFQAGGNPPLAAPAPVAKPKVKKTVKPKAKRKKRARRASTKRRRAQRHGKGARS
jgi:hypothetical protein